MNNINWYPGHMKKTRELIQENLKLVDILLEVIDARIAVSSRNPILDELVGKKRRLIILNKSDLADATENEKWLESFRQAGHDAVKMNSMSGEGVKELLKTLARMQEKKNESVAVKRPLRLMIAGVPNVGKSSLVNRLTGRKSAQTGNKPGVTKGKQWLTLENGMQLLDTPGILWPKFEDPNEGVNLALCGSIKDEILDIEDLAFKLISVLANDYADLLTERYKIDNIDKIVNIDNIDRNDLGIGSDKTNAIFDIMELIAVKRGFILSGGRIDHLRTSKVLLDEFRNGIIGRITLERA